MESITILDARVRSALACASIGGVGGFLSYDFRAHDFQLGRRNCQQFLHSSFALSDEEGNRNPLFAAGCTEEARECYRIVEGHRRTGSDRGTAPVQGDKVSLPIIPLWGTAAEEVPLMDWPRHDPAQLDALRHQLEKRFDAVTRRLIDRNTRNPIRRLSLRGARKFLEKRLADKIVRAIADDLGARADALKERALTPAPAGTRERRRATPIGRCL